MNLQKCPGLFLTLFLGFFLISPLRCTEQNPQRDYGVGSSKGTAKRPLQPYSSDTESSGRLATDDHSSDSSYKDDSFSDSSNSERKTYRLRNEFRATERNRQFDPQGRRSEVTTHVEQVERYTGSGTGTGEINKGQRAQLMMRPKDVQGHIVARRLGGSGTDLGNLFAQDGISNNGAHKKNEHATVKFLKPNSPEEHAEGLVTHTFTYPNENDNRPHSIVTVTQVGERRLRTLSRNPGGARYERNRRISDLVVEMGNVFGGVIGNTGNVPPAGPGMRANTANRGAIGGGRGTTARNGGRGASGRGMNRNRGSR